MVECKKKENGFYVGEDPQNPLAEITYHLRDERTMVIDHTYVSDTLRGQGVGGVLVRKVAEIAERRTGRSFPCALCQTCHGNRTRLSGRD